ncbi:glycosyltransferase [Candidatus Pelagibacter sp.]|uniref:glycosyltransferase n=1 Tax=Candidatus Pelagibacter sp. TaxID=2024849 RepID=UPI003F8784C2
MKILHITSELTKKNFSIASLILFISDHINKQFNYKYSILSSKTERTLFNNSNIKTLEFSNFFNVFLKFRFLQLQITRHDIIHIHGLWAPIQILSIFICNFTRRKNIIHPHGMLLGEALKGAGFLKYIYKIIFLYILKFLISKNTSFVSITDQEKFAIKKYFPRCKITEIYNPIPFKWHDLQASKKKKQFVYFGRIHPHKNIDLMIKAFKEANLDDEWKLKIYGIQDDEKYFNKLNSLIGTDKRIKFEEPIFDEKKQNVLNESWSNILLSKSEVLSLSILESSLLGLPSLANRNIDTKEIEDSIIPTDIKIEDIKEKLENISNWTLDERLHKGKNIYKNVQNITSIENLTNKYKKLYSYLEQNINDDQDLFFVAKNFKFLLITSNYMFNLMFSSFVVIALVIFGHYSVAGELGLITSFWITVTQIFSSNLRSIIVSENKMEYAFLTLFYRGTISILLIIFSYFIILKFISFENIYLITIFSILILVQWVNEMNFVVSEVKKKILLFIIFSVVNLITLILGTIFLYFSYFDLLIYLISIYIIFILITIPVNYSTIYEKNFDLNFKSIIDLNLKTIAFLSSFSIVISSFAWRIMIYFTFDKSIAGVFFACFSIGSFPGTVFNSVVGPAFIKQKIRLSQNLKIFLLILFVIIFVWFIINLNYIIDYESIIFLDRNFISFISFTVSASLIGSYFMCYSMYLRHKKIQSSLENRKYLFQKDILYGISITFLIPILYYLGGTKGVSLVFLSASLIALTAYSFDRNIKLSN